MPADPGTPLPDVPLVDQDDTPFRLARFKGNLLLVTFSFTRCPLPDYCPLMMKHFAAIEKATAKDASPSLKNARLLTVTIDPAYDTPARLREYGAKHATGDGPDKQVLALDPRHRDGGRRQEARRLLRARLLRR